MSDRVWIRSAKGVLLAAVVTVGSLLGPAAGSALVLEANPSCAPLGPSLHSLRYRQKARQSPLPAELLAGLQHEPVTLEKGRLPIGLARVFDPAIVVNRDTAPADGWTVLENGWRLWSVEVASPGALGLRLHLEALALPKGARLLVYDPQKPSHVTKPIGAEDLSPERELWVETVFAEKVVVECQVPPEADPAEVSFTVTGLSHLYRLPASLAKALFDAGPCHNDVTCFPEWAQQAAGVAEMTFVDGGTNYLCTGCLLSNADTNVTTDFFLTANHCITGQAVASTLELFWFYQTSTCDGTPPTMSSVPHTSGGADFLAGSGVNDFSFLRLRRAAPAGVFHLGWSRNLPTASETLACIQHPAGDYKRISFGNLASLDPSFRWVQWFSGVTEPGSSGAPLFNARHQVIGQLWGGDSSCDNPNGLDAFGRFDVTYRSIQRWIDPVSTLKGTFSGLFLPANGVTLQGSGSVTLTTTATGRFTGRLQAGPTRYAFTGQFDGGGNAQATASAGHSNVVTLVLHVDIAHDPSRITGTVDGGSWTAELATDRAVFDGKTVVAPQRGAYTMVFPGGSGSTNQPGGDGYATASVDAAGRFRLSGLLADGTRITQSATVSQFGQVPLYVPLYGNRGMVLSWVTFTNTPRSDLAGELSWVKPLSTAKYYPGGFDFQTQVVGSRYGRPGAGEPMLPFVNAAVVLTGANSGGGITNDFTLSTRNQVRVPANKFQLSFMPTTGLFRGSVAGAGAPQPISFSGVVLTNQSIGSGYFLGGNLSGRVRLEPAR